MFVFPANLERIWPPGEKCGLVVAEDEGKIVGFAQYFPPNSSIEAVHVLPSHVKRSVGKILVRRIEDIARNQGAC